MGDKFTFIELIIPAIILGEIGIELCFRLDENNGI
jgi:hypothetical protein